MDRLAMASADSFIVADWRKDDVAVIAQMAGCDRCSEAEAVRKEIEESECDVSSEHVQPGVDVRHVVTAQQGRPGDPRHLWDGARHVQQGRNSPFA
jgi:hypothetical protein